MLHSVDLIQKLHRWVQEDTSMQKLGVDEPELWQEAQTSDSKIRDGEWGFIVYGDFLTFEVSVKVVDK